MEEEKSLKTWVKEHKSELIILGVTIIGTVLIVKNWKSIKGVFMYKDLATTSIEKIKPAIGKVMGPVISNDVLDNLTGNHLTATELGRKLGFTAQEINKRIVAAGLATKLNGGEYSLTEAGRLLGKETIKSTRYGHWFMNIEWDEKITDIIFAKDEILDKAVKIEAAREAMRRFDA
jgi:hypothetical protein